MPETDFQLATRRANFWRDQLDIAELLGEQRYIEHAARMYFDASGWLVRIAIEDIKAQEVLHPSKADFESTHCAWQKAFEENDGRCCCDPGNDPYCAADAIYNAALFSRPVRDKIDTMAAETLCHQGADIYSDAYHAVAWEKQMAKEKAARRANRIADNAGLPRPHRRPRLTPLQKLKNRRRNKRKFVRSTYIGA